jgi:hypothetical protein
LVLHTYKDYSCINHKNATLVFPDGICTLNGTESFKALGKKEAGDSLFSDSDTTLKSATSIGLYHWKTPNCTGDPYYTDYYRNDGYGWCFQQMIPLFLNKSVKLHPRLHYVTGILLLFSMVFALP